MNDTRSPTRPQVPGEYAIRVAGHLDQRWATWFDGLTLTHHDDGTTVIDGPVVDQAALHGLLQKIRDLGLPLLSVTPAPPVTPPTSTASIASTATTTGSPS
jgi:hypothetical protein